MEQTYVMTAFAKDRPGVVTNVSGLLYENGCNLLDSTMTRLMGEFAMILAFSSRAQGIEAQLLQACRRLERDKGISAYFTRFEPPIEQAMEPLVEQTIHAEGIDHTGIVYKVSEVLTNNNINIESLSANRAQAPVSGTAMYRMDIKFQLPEDVNLNKLDKDLARAADELNVEIVRSES